MTNNPKQARITEFGEKRLIRDFIKPYFNSSDDPAGVGDDCAMVPFDNELALFSTDRIPSDLTAFKLGLLDFAGLGDYLARLNLSDIAACGGKALGLLLNLGLPDDLAYSDFKSFCEGFGKCASRHGVTVLGGDITSASELSASATSIGRVPRQRVLTRRGARPGDSVFISRPIGLTPAAFKVFLGGRVDAFSEDLLSTLRRQFTEMQPMLALGDLLSRSGKCGACMDNTDGVGQSLTELSEASHCAFVIQASKVRVTDDVQHVCRVINVSAFDLVFDGGADFSLIGTLRGKWTTESATTEFKHPLEVIGHVESGTGVWIANETRTPLKFRGWNYFASHAS